MYCNDEAVETAEVLELSSALSPWAASPNQKVKDVVKEIALLISNDLKVLL